MKTITNLIYRVGQNPLLSRALHTVWQAVLGYLLAQLTAPHASQDTTTILTGAYAAGLSAFKTFALAYLAGRRA